MRKEKKEEKEMNALLIVRGLHWQQESYESASGNARKRANQLRKLGYQVAVSSMGMQVTPVGSVRLSMVTIFNPDDNVPDVEEIRFNY